MKQHHELIEGILTTGIKKSDRTGTGTISIFGRQMRFDLSAGFPLVTTRKINLKAVIFELLWFLEGDTNIKYLNENGVHIWDKWADDYGKLGPIYGEQWVAWGQGYVKNNQIMSVVDQIKNNPNSRRHIVSAWNVTDLPFMALPPCHILSQFYVAEGKLSCQLYQRSADVFLGLPYNIASYALLTMMIAQVCGLEPGEFIHSLGDAHIYLNHIEQVQEQLEREPLPLAKMAINPEVKDIFDFKYEDFTIQNYQHHPAIKAPVAV